VLVGLSYILALGLLSQTSPHNDSVVLITLVLPLAITALAFGPLAGVGFGLITGALVSIVNVLNMTWTPVLGNPVVSTLLFTGIGAGFGLFRPHDLAKGKDVAPQDAWEHALDIQLKLKPSGHILASNLKARNVLGNVSHLFDFVHPEEKENVQQQLEYAFARDEARFALRVRVVNLEQQTVPMEAQLLRDGEHLALELHDLSEMYKLERRLSETEARYRVLIEEAIASLDTGIVVLDRNRQVMWANDALAHILGVDQQWLVGRDLDRVLEAAAPLFLTEDAVEKIAQTKAEKMTIAIQNGHGPRVFDYNSIPISTERYQGGRIDYYHDITKNKQLEEDLRRQSEQLKAGNERLEAFTHVVSHDLKEPLRTLEMFSGYVLEDYGNKLDDEGKDYLHSIGRAAKRMKGLIDDLLDLASIGRRNEPKKQVDVKTLVDNVVHDLGASLEGVELVLPERAFPHVMANHTRIEQLLSNLISNAVKYNDREKKQVRLGWTVEGNDYVFSVADNGIGIEQAYLGSRIFELFERLNPHQDNYQGTGAGLAICKRIVEAYGGRIWAESEPGQGSTFYFTLPQPNTKVVTHHEAVKDLVG